jgi:hypothetical protein
VGADYSRYAAPEPESVPLGRRAWAPTTAATRLLNLSQSVKLAKMGARSLL